MVRLVTLMILLALVPAIASPASVSAADPIRLPFPAGQAAWIVQGYNGGTHQGVERYSLDLVLFGETSNAPVVAPVSGRVEWATGPGDGNGCFAISLADASGLSVMLCHLFLDRRLLPGDPIKQGEVVGRVGPAGTLGNNNVPHIHLQLYRRERGERIPLPFAPPEGRPLEDMTMPAGDSFNLHAGPRRLISTNSSSQPPASPESNERSAGAPTARGSAEPSAQATAVVRVPAVCLNVREQPALQATRVRCLPDGASVHIQEGPVAADGHQWYRLERYGWAVGEYLEKTSAESPPAPEPSAAPVRTPDQASPAVVRRVSVCLNVRAEPTLTAPRVRCLAEGAQVSIVEGPVAADDYQWYRIDGLGWAVGEYLDQAEPAAAQPEPANAATPAETPSQPAEATVSGTLICLNVRAEPSLTASRMRCLPDGMRVTLIEGPVEADGHQWYRLDRYGWAVANYLTKSGR